MKRLDEGKGGGSVGGMMGATERGTFNNGGNQNNVSSNWLSVETLFYTKAPVSSLCFERADSFFFFFKAHTHTHTPEQSG